MSTWPSGLRRQTQDLVSFKEAWVQIPLLTEEILNNFFFFLTNEYLEDKCQIVARTLERLFHTLNHGSDAFCIAQTLCLINFLFIQLNFPA